MGVNSNLHVPPIRCSLPQDIDITNAVDWEHFFLGEGKDQDHFLVVASDTGEKRSEETAAQTKS